MKPDANTVLSLGKALDQGGTYAVIIVLLLVVVGFGILWWFERKDRKEAQKENKELHQTLREDNKEMTKAMLANTAALQSLKEVVQVALAVRQAQDAVRPNPQG